MDVLSGGRFIFGVGVGYLKPEFDALGIPMEDRGTRTLEYIEAMRRHLEHRQGRLPGQVRQLRRGVGEPEAGPARRATGGRWAATPRAAWRKAVTHCQGWYGFALDHDATTKNLEGLAGAAAKHERPAGLGKMEISVTPRGRVDRVSLDRFAELGVDRLVLIQRGDDVDSICTWIDETASALL